MKKKFTMLLASLFLVVGTAWAEVVKFDANSNLPGTLADGQYTWKSSNMEAPDGFTKLRLTFLENTGDGADKGGFPHVALAEFYLYDKDGNPVELAVDKLSSNATETQEGKSGIHKLCDGFTVQQSNEGQWDWYWHSYWSANAGAYHYLEIDVAGLTADLSTFAVGYVTRQSNGSPSEMLVTTGVSTEDVATQYANYMILGEYDLSTQAFRIKNSNITSEDLYLTIETPNCNNQNEDGVKILEKAIGNTSQAFKFIPQSDGSFQIKSESGYFLNTHESWGFNAVSEAVTTDNRSNFSLEYLAGNDEFRIKGIKGYVGPNNSYSTDHPYELFSNHGPGQQYIDWVLEPYVQEYLVTYNYKVGDEIMLTEEHVVNADAAYPAVRSFYGVSITEAAPEGNVSENATYNFTCTVDASKFPFDYAADVASIDTWQYIQMHSNNKKYLKYESNYIAWADSELGLGKKDAYAWAFVGNPFTGFKMLNKAATEAKALKSTGNDNPVMANYADGTLFLAAASQVTGNGYFCMQYPGGNYLNAQNGKLAHWGTNDAGSTMLVNGTWHEITLDEYTADLSTLIDNAETFVSNNQANANKVGYYKLTDVQAQIDNAKNYTASQNINEVDAAFLALLGVMNSPEVNLPEKGKFYRFKHPTQDAYMLSDETTKPETTEKRLAMGALANNKVSSIFYYGEDGTLLSYANGRYLPKAEASASADWTCLPIGTTGTAATFGAGSALGRVGFYLTSGRAYWSGHGTYVDAGGSFGLNAGYDWEVEEVTWLPFPVNSTLKYGTLYSPVPLNRTTGASAGRVKVYTGSVEGDYLVLTEIEGDIPANTPVIVEMVSESGYENGCVFLEILDDVAPLEVTNDLVGQTTAHAKSTEGTPYTLQSNDSDEDGVADGVVFRKYTGDNLSGFKAYLVLDETIEAQSIRIRFADEETTGIEPSTLNPQPSTQVYDLMGRRVEKMEKGIYIVNGKKVIK